MNFGTVLLQFLNYTLPIQSAIDTPTVDNNRIQKKLPGNRKLFQLDDKKFQNDDFSVLKERPARVNKDFDKLSDEERKQELDKFIEYLRKSVLVLSNSDIMQPDATIGAEELIQLINELEEDYGGNCQLKVSVRDLKLASYGYIDFDLFERKSFKTYTEKDRGQIKERIIKFSETRKFSKNLARLLVSKKSASEDPESSTLFDISIPEMADVGPESKSKLESLALFTHWSTCFFIELKHKYTDLGIVKRNALSNLKKQRMPINPDPIKEPATEQPTPKAGLKNPIDTGHKDSRVSAKGTEETPSTSHPKPRILNNKTSPPEKHVTFASPIVMGPSGAVPDQEPPLTEGLDGTNPSVLKTPTQEPPTIPVDPNSPKKDSVSSGILDQQNRGSLSKKPENENIDGSDGKKDSGYAKYIIAIMVVASVILVGVISYRYLRK